MVDGETRKPYRRGVRVSRIWVPSGFPGTMMVLRTMQRLIHAGRTHPLVRDTALRITADIPGRNGTAQAVAIRGYLASVVQFTRDPRNEELLYAPWRALMILRDRGPPLRLDCDDVAMLGASLGGAIGLRCRLLVVAFRSPSSPYRHVWSELRAPDRDSRWVELDVTRASQAIPVKAISKTLVMEC